MDMNGCVICDVPIEPTYHWLADHYPNLCHAHKEEVHARRQAKFQEHLENASKAVEGWPEWKKKAIGVDF